MWKCGHVECEDFHISKIPHFQIAMPVHGDSETALREADQAMYADKATKPGGRRRRA
jgi:hypothetical protein